MHVNFTFEHRAIVSRKSPITHGLIFFTFACAFSAEAFASDISCIIAVAASSPLRRVRICSVAKYIATVKCEKMGYLAAWDKYLVRRSEVLALVIFFKRACAHCWKLLA